MFSSRWNRSNLHIYRNIERYLNLLFKEVMFALMQIFGLALDILAFIVRGEGVPTSRVGEGALTFCTSHEIAQRWLIIGLYALL